MGIMQVSKNIFSGFEKQNMLRVLNWEVDICGYIWKTIYKSYMWICNNYT